MEHKRKKIALIYDAVYPYIKGGAEKRFFELGKGLYKRGYEIHFYGMKLWKGKSTIKQNGMYYHGICRDIPLYKQNGKRSIKEAVIFGINCLKLIKEDFDIIDCCGFPYFSLFPCKLVCTIKRKPLFSTWHEVWGKEYWIEYLGLKGYVGYLVEKLAALTPHKIISVSESTTRLLRQRLKSRKLIHTIKNGIDLDFINNIPEAEEKSDVIFAGRLVYYKNIDKLIKSIGLVKKEIPDVKCLIVGDGPEKHKLEKLVQELDLNRNIRFTGFIKDQSIVYSYIKASKVFMLPSEREGFGIVLVEANACGLPVITVDHDNNAAKDLIKESKNGFLCILKEEEMAEKIISVLKNKHPDELRNRCKASGKEYDWENIINEVEKVYTGLIRK